MGYLPALVSLATEAALVSTNLAWLNQPLRQSGCLYLCIVQHVQPDSSDEQQDLDHPVCLKMPHLTLQWPHAEWFSDLLTLLVMMLRDITTWPTLFCQPHIQRYHQQVHSFQFHEWEMSGYL